MSKCILYLLLLFSGQSSYAQYFMKCAVSKENVNRIDSMRNQLKKDKQGSFVALFNMDFYGKNAYGCVVFYENKKVTGHSISFVEAVQQTSALTEKNIKKNQSVLDELFSGPNAFVSRILGTEYANISHTNAMYLLIQVDGLVLFDRFFCSSQLLTSPNENGKRLIMALKDMVIH